MVRFVVRPGPDGGWTVRLDPTSSAPGRGAHLHPDAGCWRAALRGGFARSFRRRVTVETPDAAWAD